MGAVAAKCSDISKHAGGKPLDADDSEDEEDEGEEEEFDEDDEAEEAAHFQEIQAEAEVALSEGLKRGKTSHFSEVINHARGIGIDPEKIRKAEERLQQHKATRRKEAFEAEMQAFLQSDESNDIDACKEKIKEGMEYGVSDSALAAVRERITDLNQSRDLTSDEVAQAKVYVEGCTRRFVGSCVKDGRETTWLDVESGKRTKARIRLDLVLKNLSVESRYDERELASVKLADAVAKRATDVAELVKTSAFGKLSEDERECAVAVTGCEESWLFVETNIRSQDEFVMAITVLNGLCMEESGAKSARGKKKTKDHGKSPAAPAAVAKIKRLKSQESNNGWNEEEPQPADSNEADNNSPADSPPLPPPADEEAEGDAEEEPAAAPEKGEKEKKDKKDKKEKKEKKDKKEK